MSPLAALRRNPKRRLGALSALAIAGAIAVGSGANFTSASANPANTFTAGTLSQANSNGGSAILNAAQLKPGDKPTTGLVDIENTGDIAGAFTLGSTVTADTNPNSATVKLSGKLDLEILDCGLWADKTTPPSCEGSGTNQVYSGKVGAMPGSVPVGTFAAGGKHRYKFLVTFPDGGAGGADNVYQGAATTVKFDWTAAQS